MSTIKATLLGLVTLALFGGHAARAQPQGAHATMSVKASERAQLVAEVEPATFNLGLRSQRRALLPEPDEYADRKVVEKAISNPVAFTVVE